MMNCQKLLKKHSPIWENATTHSFLEECKNGTIKPQQFNTWLVQDYLFVVEFTRMVARTLSVAPIAHFDVIISGLNALKDELKWFEAKAIERKLYLHTQKQPTCTEYCEFMNKLTEMPYPVQATAFWAIELAYNQGWQLPGEMPPPYHEFANRWGNSEFTNYVKLLEQQTNEVLQNTSQTIQSQAEATFLNVARLEKDFWQMAYNSTN
ncbi:MAG: TenA family transcriptional regulator [Microcoleaceae cyanobacterium]